MPHCLDANVLIEAHRSRYPMDIVPGFWEALLKAAKAGDVISINAVYDELSSSGDELSAWAEEHRSSLFLPNDDPRTQAAIIEVGRVLDERRPAYRQEAKDVFHAGADPWLAAFCKAQKHILVTEEIGAAQSRARRR